MIEANWSLPLVLTKAHFSPEAAALRYQNVGCSCESTLRGKCASGCVLTAEDDGRGQSEPSISISASQILAYQHGLADAFCM